MGQFSPLRSAASLASHISKIHARGAITAAKPTCYRHYSSSLPADRDVRIVEVGPRDGLQNIKQVVDTATKIQLIRRLADTGLRDIEATSFVSPKWVPQLADGAKVMSDVLTLGMSHRESNLQFPVLAPNMKGLENASKAGAKEIVVFASVTEAFSKANQNCTVSEALDQAEVVTREATSRGIKVRGVISCIFSDPFSGSTAPEAVLPVVQRLLSMGCYEVGLGDTLGVGTAMDTQRLLELLLKHVPIQKLAGHFHDTYGQGISNIVRAYDMGIRTFDSSVAGLGGCPYAPGAKGNVATEDVVYTLEKAGIRTGVDIDKLIDVGQWISKELGIAYGSRAGAALATRRASQISKPATKLAPKKQSKWELVEDAGEYRISRSGKTLRVTLTRPKNGNALTNDMLLGLTNLFRDLAIDPSVYHVVIDAEGKYFCTGMDLSGGTDTASMDAESSYYSKVLNLYNAIDQAPQTTIALVDGPCFGGGVGLTFVCDARIVSPRAKWTLSEVKIGVSPAVISKYMVREWGISKAREAMISGRQVGAEELLRVGAVHAISDGSESLEQKLDSYLDQLAKCAPRSVAVNKQLSWLAWNYPESRAQSELIEATFGSMMADGSEGQHGIGKFQSKEKSVDWTSFWGSRSPVEGLDFVKNRGNKVA